MKCGRDGPEWERGDNKPVTCFWVVWIFVRVAFQGLLSIRLLDLQQIARELISYTSQKHYTETKSQSPDPLLSSLYFIDFLLWVTAWVLTSHPGRLVHDKVVFIRSLKRSRKQFRGSPEAATAAFCTYTSHAKDLAHILTLWLSLARIQSLPLLISASLLQTHNLPENTTELGRSFLFLWRKIALDASSPVGCFAQALDVPAKQYMADFTGENRTQPWGNWTQRCNPSVSQPFKQQHQWAQH